MEVSVIPCGSGEGGYYIYRLDTLDNRIMSFHPILFNLKNEIRLLYKMSR